MGSILSSCCGRRQKTGEREPLLPQHRSQEEQPEETLIPSQNVLNKIAGIIAALREGKMPDQNQLNAFIQKVNDLGILDPNSTSVGQSSRLSAAGQLVVQDIQQLLQRVIEIGLEKNSMLLSAYSMKILQVYL